MDIIKETCGRVCVIRTNTYAHTVNHILMLGQEMQKDFPDLLMGNARVVQYGGNRQKGTFGIEFEMPLGYAAAPHSYERITQLELTLG